MSPSPGTSRCDDAIVPTLKSLTCTRRMRSTPSRIVSREPALGPARVQLHAHAGVEPAGEIDRVAQRVHEAHVDAQRVGVLDREGNLALACDCEHGLERGLERVGGFLPRERRERPGREHHALGADRHRGVERVEQALLLLRPLRRVGEVERTEADEVGDAQTARDRVGDEPRALDPSEAFELRDRHADRIDVVTRPRTRGPRRARGRRSRSRSRTRGVHRAHPSVERARDCCCRRRAGG